MVRDPDETRAVETASSSPGLSQEEREIVGGYSFRKEADTLTAHGFETLKAEEPDERTTAIRRDVPRRDTMPVPPSAPKMSAAPLSRPQASAPPASRLHPSSRPLPPPSVPKKRASSFEVDVVDIDESDLIDDDTTQASTEPFTSSEDSTSPTLSLADRSASAREVYRLFLDGEYAPALALANELIAQGDDDPMLITIARECRASLEDAHRSSPPSGGEVSDESPARLFVGIHGKMTLDEVALMTGMSLNQIVKVLERFVVMGVIRRSPPSR